MISSVSALVTEKAALNGCQFFTVTLLYNLFDAINFPAIVVSIQIRFYSESKSYQMDYFISARHLVAGITQSPTLLLHSYQKSQ